MLVRSLRPRLVLALLVAVSALGIFAPPAQAQAQAQNDPPSDRLPAAVELHLGVTRAAGVAAGFAGFTAHLEVRNRFRIGGGAWSVLRRIDEGDVLAESGMELGLGWGGVFGEVGLGDLPASARLLVGGGAATLRTATVGTPFDTQIFVVVEPALVGSVALPGPFAFGATAGYRWVLGADDLLTTGAAGLRGPQGAVFLRLGG